MVKKRIILVDDEPLIPVLMKEIIEEDQELEIARIATKKEEFLDEVSQNTYDAAIVDISIGSREGGMEVLQIVKNKEINLPLIILSAHDELHYALKCLQAGAKAYINKKYICSDVIKCIKQVFSGRLYVSGDKGEQILRQYSKLNATISVESQ